MDGSRRQLPIEALWAVDGRHVLRPPRQIRETAAGLGLDHTTLEARGHDVIETWVLRSYGPARRADSHAAACAPLPP